MSSTKRSIVLGLVTAATLLLELSMTRLFSVVMFYHFAFLAISLALFGLGASGLYLYLRQQRFPQQSLASSVSMSSSLAGLACVVALVVALSQAITIDYSTKNILRLALIYVASLVPFFFSGMVVSLILFHGAKEISKLYFYDLTGAALGALATVPLLNLIGAINAQLCAALIFCAAGSLAAVGSVSRFKAAVMVVAVAVGVLFVANLASPLLTVRYTKGLEKERIEFQKWNSFSFITVQGTEGEQVTKSIDIDADARTYIVRDPFGGFGVDVIKNEIATGWLSHVPNVLLDSGDVLIIGPGGGIDVVFALAWGAKSVDAAEINPIIVDDVMHGKYRTFSGGLYDRPDVKVYKSEGRSFVARSEKKYDMIQLTLVDTWAASSAGAFSLSENNLYTVEAFKDYINHLTPDGILAITRWLTPQPKEGLRLMAIAMDAAKSLRIAQSHQHIAIVGSFPAPGREQEMMTFIFKKSPLTNRDLSQVQDKVAAVNGRFVFSPSMRETNLFTQLAYAPDLQKFYREYEFNIEPTTDDQPFFFNTVRGADLGRIMSMEYESRKNNLGLFNLYIASVISLVLVVLFLVGPLLLSGSGRQSLKNLAALKSLAYFVFIGLGFIMIEISLMQKLILYLGHPVYSLVVVLSVILICAGIGSFLTRHQDHQTSRRRGMFIFPGTIVFVVLLTLLIPTIISATFDLGLGLRILIATFLLAPLGLLLGQPFPLELKYVEHHRKETIPWVWSLNGAASVLGSVAAVALAMAYGFTTVLLIGAGCYVVAWVMRGR